MVNCWAKVQVDGTLKFNFSSMIDCYANSRSMIKSNNFDPDPETLEW